MSRKHKTEPINFGEFKTGDPDPTTGKPITYIVFQTNQFIVNIDKGKTLNWSALANMSYAKDFGEVVSKVNLAEALVDRIFRGKSRVAYKKILGEALARLLDEANSKAANLIVEEARSRVLEHCKVKVRMAYITTAVYAVMAAGICMALALFFRGRLSAVLNSLSIFRILLCTLLGGIGAFITTFARFQNYEGSIISGLAIHRLDGFLRVFYGLISGIIISLAIKGNMIAGFADSAGQPWILYFFAIIAGASEVLIPNLVKQTEENTKFNTPPATPVSPIPKTTGTADKNDTVQDDEVLGKVKATIATKLTEVPDDEVPEPVAQLGD